MAQTWQVWMNDKVHGPYPKAELKKFLKPDTLVWDEASQAWKPAQEFDGLKDLFKLPGAEPKPSAKAATQPAQGANAAKPSPKGAASRWSADFEWTLKNQIIAGVLAVAPLALYFGYQYFYMGSDQQVRAEFGTPTGDCKQDLKASVGLCKERTALCGCTQKGSCDMPSCRTYAKLNK